jgi:RNA polymerase sporulation-specific sigma factor
MPRKKRESSRPKDKKITKELVYSFLQIPEKTFRDMQPSEVKTMMNSFALYIKQNGMDEVIFNRILAYMHKFISNMASSQFIIAGMDSKDIYQEASQALHLRAIDKFNPNKNMSFVNFAKMCMRRYIITLLNTSRNRKKDQPLNRSMPLDQIFPSEDDGDDGGCLLNVLSDDVDFIEDMCRTEDVRKTRQLLEKNLSPLERDVFTMHLEKRSYKDIAREVSRIYGRYYNEKSVDNALIRVRAKAIGLKISVDLPLFVDES